MAWFQLGMPRWEWHCTSFSTNARVMWYSPCKNIQKSLNSQRPNRIYLSCWHGHELPFGYHWCKTFSRIIYFTIDGKLRGKKPFLIWHQARSFRDWIRNIKKIMIGHKLIWIKLFHAYGAKGLFKRFPREHKRFHDTCVLKFCPWVISSQYFGNKVDFLILPGCWSWEYCFLIFCSYL